ncbi:C40 family peptidase [Streptomyces sp. NPDC056222]|uniref:C40 family peptidase n=1 Tax=Streptomyces sp. NPDC056222 TaxID=3345749 RepID=UPI0035D5FCCB
MSASMSTPSRRSALAALVGVAAGSSLPLASSAGAATPATTTTTTTTTTAATTATTAAVPTVPGGRLPMVLDPSDPWHFGAHPAGALTTRTLTGTSVLLEVSDDRGVLATLTTGARTVTLRGPKRWFTEQKKPFSDAFSRTLPAGQTGWGSSPGGGKWSTHNGADADYFLEGGRAAIRLTAANSSRHALLPDKAVGDVDARARFSFDKVPTGAPVSLALTFAATDVNNHYRARLNITPAGEVQLLMEKELANATSTLSSAVTVGTGFAAFDHWWVRVEKTGDVLRARAWSHSAAEPTTWHHSLRDPEKDPAKVFGSGTVGVRALASSGATVPLEARVYDFDVVSAEWTDPPVISHDTWVRVLPAPFDGSWTPALEQQIRAWAGDTSPDALAYASMFRPFAPAVTDPALQGANVLGTSGYSEPDAAGLRYVGADFHEYMGLDWTFPASGESVVAETQFKGHLDCSGFVRMVYGHHLGIPMVGSKNFDGRNLPRTSKNQSASGPGVVVSQATGAAPSLAPLRIGDVVFFDATDAEPDDPETTDGVIDHTGIYVGQDQHGGLRFVSSRRTPNGPTLADLGAKSILNGKQSVPAEGVKGDLYTASLRVIRRF